MSWTVLRNTLSDADCSPGVVLTGQSANAENFGQNPLMPAYGLFPADQFVIINGSCADCDALPQARWFFRGETIAVPKKAELLAG